MKHLTGNTWIVVVVVAAMAPFYAFGDNHGVGKSDAEAPGFRCPYTVQTCPVMGTDLGSMGEPIAVMHEGREVHLCCQACVTKFNENPEKYLEKVDELTVEMQKPMYPLDTCVVSGEKLGGMGEPVDHVYENRLVRLCCAGCVATFDKDPGKYLAKIDAAVIEKQKDSYPLDTCLVSGRTLAEGKAVDQVVGTRLVRFCGSGCVDAFNKNPAKYLAKLDGACKAACDKGAVSSCPMGGAAACKPAASCPMNKSCETIENEQGGTE